MSRRSAMNARYQKHTTPAGKTRKSAAAAKPKREAGNVASSSASSKSQKPAQRRGVMVELPEAARKWRRAWFGLLAGGFVLAVVSILTQQSVPLLSTITVIAAYVCIGAGLFIDFRLVRPALNAARAGTSSAKDTKTKSAEQTTTSDTTAEKPGDAPE